MDKKVEAVVKIPDLKPVFERIAKAIEHSNRLTIEMARSATSVELFNGQGELVESVPAENHYDDETLNKVYRTFRVNGYTTEDASDMIGALQNAGILFRERS